MTWLVKSLPALQVTWVRSLGWKDPLEEERATHSRILAWRMRGLVGYSPWGHRVGLNHQQAEKAFSGGHFLLPLGNKNVNDHPDLHRAGLFTEDATQIQIPSGD